MAPDPVPAQRGTDETQTAHALRLAREEWVGKALRVVLDQIEEERDRQQERACRLEDDHGLEHPTVAEAYGVVEGLDTAERFVRKVMAGG